MKRNPEPIKRDKFTVIHSPILLKKHFVGKPIENLYIFFFSNNTMKNIVYLIPVPMSFIQPIQIQSSIPLYPTNFENKFY